MTILIIIVLLVILVAGWVMSTQRRLVVMDENINNAMSQIGVQLSSRFDALTALLDLAKGYAAHESQTLIETIKSRRSVITAKSTPQDVLQQEGVISEALGRISMVAERYPELKADKGYAKCMDAVDSYEKMVRTSRLIYNDSVTKLNREIRMFPVSLIAGMLVMLLGTDNDMNADWDNGVFYDNFRGVWGAIDGHMVYMELAYDGEDYNLYSVPILLNGEAYNLQVAYDFSKEEWSILGASQGLDDTGMASKELRLLEAGDQITTIWQMSTYSGDDDFEMYAAEEFTVTDQTAFSETALPDGNYAMVITMQDAAGNEAYSDAVTFQCQNGEITTTVYQ